MKEVISMHGWSGDSNSWKEWMVYFKSQGWSWQNGERGYGTMPPRNPQWQSKSVGLTTHRKVVIGHSLGPHLVDLEVLSQATDLVLLGSFSRFIPKDQTSRVLLTALKGMKKHLGTEQENTMLNAFLTKTCLPNSTNSLLSGPIQNGISPQGREKLKADLDLLIKTKHLPKGFPPSARVLVVEGEKDSIVLPASRRH